MSLLDAARSRPLRPPELPLPGRRGGSSCRAAAGLLVLIGVLLIAALAGPGTARAAATPWQSATLADGVSVEARLITAVDGPGALETVPAGLEVRLPEGWKTYWRSPGDAGLPPRLDWTGSTNLAAADLAYPAPHRFRLFGLETFGYGEQVVFPIDLTPAVGGAAMDLAARADLLVCADLCVPVSYDFRLNLPQGPATPDPDTANTIARWAAQVPADGAASGLTVAAVAADPADPAGALIVEATAREPFDAPDILVEAGDWWMFGPPEAAFDEGGSRMVARLPVTQSPGDGSALDGREIILTLVDGGRAMETTATVAPPDTAPALAATTGASAGGSAGSPAGSGSSTAAAGLPALAGILGIAFLGGLILNLMPCVLPVLSLKLLSLAGQGGRAPRQIRLGFLASAAGILASFLVLAGGAIALKAAGGAVGWGIQFQQPLFLVFMVVLLTLFAANLLGFFEIRLPGTVADAAVKAGGEAGHAPHRLGGHFATGAFAALLATPCSAPFLGTAVGFALSRGPFEILAVFAALGLGLAAPYLAVAAVPQVAAALPRPGRWMIVLKRVLAAALALTAVWLLSVLAVQASAVAAWLIGALMVAVAAFLWGRRRLEGGLRLASGGAAVVLALGAFVLPGRFDAPANASASAGNIAWTAFDLAEIDRRVAAGEVVLVDVTADWCITCQANKALVLQRGEVAERLDGDVLPMQADWTRPNPAITAYLESFGRYGIPFNAVYGPGATEGIPLPELLTPDAVLEAMARAGERG